MAFRWLNCRKHAYPSCNVYGRCCLATLCSNTSGGWFVCVCGGGGGLRQKNTTFTSDIVCTSSVVIFELSFSRPLWHHNYDVDGKRFAICQKDVIGLPVPVVTVSRIKIIYHRLSLRCLEKAIYLTIRAMFCFVLWKSASFLTSCVLWSSWKRSHIIWPGKGSATPAGRRWRLVGQRNAAWNCQKLPVKCRFLLLQKTKILKLAGTTSDDSELKLSWDKLPIDRLAKKKI